MSIKVQALEIELLRGDDKRGYLNQLTPYLALCEGHDPVTLRIPFEHHELLDSRSTLEPNRHPQMARS
jgi:hypothetical protein